MFSSGAVEINAVFIAGLTRPQQSCTNESLLTRTRHCLSLFEPKARLQVAIQIVFLFSQLGCQEQVWHIPWVALLRISVIIVYTMGQSEIEEVFAENSSPPGDSCLFFLRSI
jgi:hypothetical protein